MAFGNLRARGVCAHRRFESLVDDELQQKNASGTVNPTRRWQSRSEAASPPPDSSIHTAPILQSTGKEFGLVRDFKVRQSAATAAAGSVRKDRLGDFAADRDDRSQHSDLLEVERQGCRGDPRVDVDKTRVGQGERDRVRQLATVDRVGSQDQVEIERRDSKHAIVAKSVQR